MRKAHSRMKKKVKKVKKSSQTSIGLKSQQEVSEEVLVEKSSSMRT